MDDDSCEPVNEHNVNTTVPPYETSLTEPVPQDFQHPPAPSSTLSRYLDTPLSPSETLPDHPFDFPTLNLDGSLPHLATHAGRRYPPTPPAALSSLGARARARMAEQDSSVTEAEPIESHYDMIDDLSEMSTDDHDTASITTNGEEEHGQLTPDDACSELDADESTLFVDDARINTPPSTAQSFVNLPAHDTSIHQSYTSDDLETPRQSSLPVVFSNIRQRSVTKPSKQPHSDLSRILFISNANISQSLMDSICAKVTACMNPAEMSNPLEHKIVRLPATPSGIVPPSATVVYANERVVATVQHCIYAETRSQDSFKLRIMDADGEHSSFFTVGGAAKLDVDKPDIVVFYLDEHVINASWLPQAVKAVEILDSPTLVVRDRSIKLGSPFSRLRTIARNSKHSRSITTDSLFASDQATVSGLLDQILRGKSVSSFSYTKRTTTEVIWRVVALLCLLAPLIGMIPAGSTWSSNLDTASAQIVRRAALIEALANTTISSNVTKDFSIDHLLSPLLLWCHSTTCEPTPHSEGVAPNYFVLALPAQPHFPQITTTHVSKADGHTVTFNHSQLIEGVHLITIDPEEAHGTVTFNMLTRKPGMNITATHNYGNRMLQRKTYEKAGTEVGKAVSKDVAVMRDAAKSLTEKLSTELGVSVGATKNVTTQIAMNMAKDLQAIKSSVASLFGKAAKVSNQTVSELSKDFVLVQRDVARFSKDVSTFVQSKVTEAKNNSKALIRSPLSVSRERLRSLKKALRRNKTAISSTVKKEVAKLKREVGRARRKSRMRHAKKSEEKKVMPVAHKPVDALKAKRELKKVAQKLETVSKLIKKQQDKHGRKLTRSELRRLKKEAREHEKVLNKMKADIERVGHD